VTGWQQDNFDIPPPLDYYLGQLHSGRWAVVDLFSVAGSARGRDFNVAATDHCSATNSPKKRTFGAIDRLVFVGLYRLFPRVLDALTIVRPGTVIRWHRAGFSLYWRSKSRPRGGRPPVPLEIRRLIREMSTANPLWGAPRIHGELLKLDIAIGQTSVAKYMAKRRGPPSQGWKTFLRNHADGIAAIDLFVVPTISFRLLYGLLIMGHDRRQVIWFGVTTHPTAGAWKCGTLSAAARSWTDECNIASGSTVRWPKKSVGRIWH
jgi:hypothetical protein